MRTPSCPRRTGTAPRHWRIVLTALPAAFLLTGPSAQANDLLDQMLEMSLEELIEYEVVAPTRTQQSLASSPGSVSVITYDQIQASSAQTIPELLRRVPGVNVRWNPMVQTIDVRGYGSNPFTNKILLLIDGVPYNSWNKGGFPQHPGFDFFNLQNVKHIEIIRGSGSALYGENALNGVINIVTLSGEEVDATRARVVSGDRNTRSISGSIATRTGQNSSFLANVRAIESQLPTELWAENDSRASGYDVFLKGKIGGWLASLYRRSDDFDGYEHSVGGGPLPPGTFFRSAPSIEQTINILAAQYHHESDDGNWSVTSNLSLANRDGSHCAACHSNPQSPRFGEQEDHGDQLFGNVDIAWNGLAKHELLLGLEARSIDAGAHTAELAGPESEVDNDVQSVTTYSKRSVYLQDSYSFLDGRGELIGSVRFEGATSPALFGSRTFPRLAAVFNPRDQLTVRASWSTAARYPSFSELYQNSWFLAAETPVGVIPLATFEPNENLQPEEIESFEAGLSYVFSDRLVVSADAYSNEITDSIVIAYPSIRFENHPSDARIRGVEVDVRFEPSERVSTYANWSYQSTTQNNAGADSNGNPLELTYAPKHKINFGADYTPRPNFRAMFELSWQDEYMAPAFWYGIVFPTDPVPRPLDDFAYLNVNLEFRPQLGTGRPMIFSLSAKNLLDERPFETLTGFGGRNVGREVFFSAEYVWSR